MIGSLALPCAVLAALLAIAGPAEAHHAMGGALPDSLADGLVSGLAHPMIGLDHLAFIVAAGLVAALLGSIWLPAVFVGASILGVVIHLLELDLPLAELVIAASVLAIGAFLASGRRRGEQGVWLAVFAFMGIFHGYAYGESIVGAEPTPLAAYLAGLAIVQTVVVVGIAAAASRWSWRADALQLRLAGAAVFGVGLTAVMGQLLPG